MAKPKHPKQYKACGQYVDRSTFRSLWLQHQARELAEQWARELPTSRKDYSEEKWNNIRETDKLIKEQIKHLLAWAKQEKDVDLNDYWKEDKS